MVNHKQKEPNKHDFDFAVVAKRNPGAEKLALKIAKNLKAGVDERTAKALQGLPVSRNPGLVVVVGGDGTVLYSESVYNGVPKLVIAYGKVCFLSEVGNDAWETGVKAVLAKKYSLEKRDKLSSNILPDALNEYCVVSNVPNKMIELEIYVDDQKALDIRGDGMVVCTPTGSTAYALASGGPIIVPGCDVFGIVPIAPFMLRSRPLVISDERTIKIVPKNHAKVAVDGGEVREVCAGTEIIIRKSKTPAWLVRTKKPNFFDKLNII